MPLVDGFGHRPVRRQRVRVCNPIWMHIAVWRWLLKGIDGTQRRLAARVSNATTNTCPYCAYELTGLVSSHCPECGWHVDWEVLRGRKWLVPFDRKRRACGLLGFVCGVPTVMIAILAAANHAWLGLRGLTGFMPWRWAALAAASALGAAQLAIGIRAFRRLAPWPRQGRLMLLGSVGSLVYCCGIWQELRDWYWLWKSEWWFQASVIGVLLFPFISLWSCLLSMRSQSTGD